MTRLIPPKYTRDSLCEEARLIDSSCQEEVSGTLQKVSKNP